VTLRKNRLALLILCGYCLLALVYARAMPLFESSDEAAHFLNAHNLLTDRALPIIPSRAQITAETDPVRQWSIESHQPPLYYLIGAVFISPTQRDDLHDYLQPNPLIFIRGITKDNHHKWLHPPETEGDTAVAIWMMRLYSLALSAGTLWLIYRAALLAFDSEQIALTAMLLVACIPTYLNIGSSVNNDNLVIFLYTAGVYLSLRMWRYGIRDIDITAISAVLAAVALTKITGLTLFGVVCIDLLIGVIQKRYPLRRAALVVGCSLGAAAIFAGWWYLRNWSLYGDPIAAAATQTLWGREFAKPAESGSIIGEITRVWRSFWMMVGHLHNPVYGAELGYLYLTLISLAGLVGILRSHLRKEVMALLVLVVLFPLLTLAIGTRSIDISYGRLLFPALVGFAPLLVIGWRAHVGRFAPLLILPLAALALRFPLQTLPDAYPRLEAVMGVAEDAIPVNISAGALTLVAYESHTETAAPGDMLRFTLYLTGAHPENPALYLTLLDPVTDEALATGAVYPGMAGTDDLRGNTLYRAPVTLTLCGDCDPLPPRQLKLQLGWQTALNTDYLPMTDANGESVPALVLSAATLIDPRYTPPEPEGTINAVFGDVTALDGVDLEQEGERVMLRLYWRTLKPLPETYVATVQLLDESGELVTQQDGEIPGYPSVAWREGVRVVEERVLMLPPDFTAGAIYIGWYRLSDFMRLPVEGGINDLYRLEGLILRSPLDFVG
jgi:4-amino-4-deoxy-L-arabinose transferase-like glycosyltransferase